MLVSLAALLLFPQLGSAVSLSAEKAALENPAAISTSSYPIPSESSLPPEIVSMDVTAYPFAWADVSLPDPPVPAAVNAPTPVAFLRPGRPITVSVGELKAENRRNLTLWRGLVIASSGAATLDAWSTRHAITTAGAQELNPMLKPFAGNASIYAAIQVGPALMDFVGKKMMYSRHSWMRRMWWVPQSASFAGSLFCGAHNLSFH